MVALEELVNFKGGGTPSKSIESYWGGNIPWASVKDFKSSDLSNTTDFITEEGLKSSASNLIPAGNLIVPTRMALGKVAINTIDVAINQDLRALIVKDEKLIDKRYLLRFLESKSKYLESAGNGATVKGITLDVLKELKVPLPSLAEQKRIAAILDKADAIRRKRQQAIQLADDFLRAVFLDMFGDPVTNPKGWEVKALSTLVSKLGDGLHGTPKYDDNGEYYFINGNNLNNGNIEINDSVKKVNKVEFEKHKKDLNERTMLVSINGTIGKVAYYRGEKILLGKSACYFNIIPEYVSDVYLFHLIQSNYFFYYTGTVFTGSTIKNVSLKSMREFPVPLPPKYIQEEFVAKAIKIEKMKKRIFYSLAEQQKLFESLSQKAFAGEL